MMIARHRFNKHIPATHEHATIGRLLLGNGAVNRLRQQYRLCFLLGPYKVVIREASVESGSSCNSTEQYSEENWVESSEFADAGNGKKTS
jgi:hypothetical protein